MSETDIREYFTRDNILAAVGLCFLWSCFRLDSYANDFLSQASALFSPLEASLVDNAYTLTLLVGFLALLGVAFRWGDVLRSRGIVAAAGAFGLVGMALVAMSAQATAASVGLAAAGLVCTALFVAVATVGCGVVLSQARPGVAAVSAAVSYVAYVLLLSCLGAVGFEMSYLAPAVVTVCLLAQCPREAVPACTARSLKELPWVMIVGSVILIYLGSWLLGEGLVGFRPNASDLLQLLLRVMFVGLGALILVPLGAGGYSQRKLVVAFGGLIILYCAIALLAVLFPSFVNALPANKALFRMFLWVALAYTVAGRGLSAYPAFSVYGIAVACFAHPLTSGLIHGQGFLHGLLESPGAVSVVAVAMFLAVTLIVVLVVRWYLSSDGERAAADAACDPGSVASCEGCAASCAARAVPTDPVQMARQRVARAAEGRGLTTREEEVAVLAYRGFSAKGIGEELFLSESTVRGYLGHMYRKMGIHRKQEFIDLVDTLND